MKQRQATLEVSTRGRGMFEFTEDVARWAKAQGISEGLLTLFIQHTSASLLIQENADPDVQSDLERFFSKLVPDGDPLFEHTAEGPDDMPSHVRAALTQTQISIPVRAGELCLGAWQGIYLYEHRRAGHRRKVLVHLFGE